MRSASFSNGIGGRVKQHLTWAVSDATNDMESEPMQTQNAAQESRSLDQLVREPLDDFARRVAEMDVHELRERVVRQRDYIASYASCLDNLPLLDHSGTTDGCRLPDDIRRNVERTIERLSFERSAEPSI